jgi:hypothetical protein
MSELEAALAHRDELLARCRAGQKVSQTALGDAVRRIALASLADMRKQGRVDMDSQHIKVFRADGLATSTAEAPSVGRARCWRRCRRTKAADRKKLVSLHYRFSSLPHSPTSASPKRSRRSGKSSSVGIDPRRA